MQEQSQNEYQQCSTDSDHLNDLEDDFFAEDGGAVLGENIGEDGLITKEGYEQVFIDDWAIIEQITGNPAFDLTNPRYKGQMVKLSANLHYRLFKRFPFLHFMLKSEKGIPFEVLAALGLYMEMGRFAIETSMQKKAAKEAAAAQQENQQQQQRPQPQQQPAEPQEQPQGRDVWL